ncbi:MAG: 2-dehydro-3-deoxygalactonokinase [Gemmatimonadaceae bacterium]|nr:2-dehydro-3-deoxygalactonokinase [Chitinophagaceae bacterium]
MHPFLLSCDWGSSSFRLKLAGFGNQEVIAESHSTDGIISVHKRFAATGNGKPDNRHQVYLAIVKDHIDRLEMKTDLSLKGAPLLISGMAGSSIGITELNYSTLPFHLDGRSVTLGLIPSSENFPWDVCLISGVSADADVMRGEETQVIGLAARLPQVLNQDAICVLPGTHSKHISIEGGKITGFNTYMTGEIFDCISNYSLLNNAISAPPPGEKSDSEEKEGFFQGVEESSKGNLLDSLFTVRTNQLFNKLTKTANHYYLSGLLIGAELNALKDSADRSIILACGEKLNELYRLGFEYKGLSSRTTCIDPVQVDNAVVAGHFKIFQSTGKIQ